VPIVRTKPTHETTQCAGGPYGLFVKQPPLPCSRELRRGQLLRQRLRHVAVDVSPTWSPLSETRTLGLGEIEPWDVGLRNDKGPAGPNAGFIHNPANTQRQGVEHIRCATARTIVAERVDALVGREQAMAYGRAGTERKKCPPETNGWSHGPHVCP